jgi:hypothetical protein
MVAVAMVVSISPFTGTYLRNSDGRIRPEGPAMPRSPSRNGSAGFFPCREGAAFLAGQKSRLTPSSALLRA